MFIFWSIGNSFFPAICVLYAIIFTIKFIRVSDIFEIIFMIACAIAIIDAENKNPSTKMLDMSFFLESVIILVFRAFKLHVFKSQKLSRSLNFEPVTISYFSKKTAINRKFENF